jgi:hypothetical protein
LSGLTESLLRSQDDAELALAEQPAPENFKVLGEGNARQSVDTPKGDEKFV